MNSTLFPLDFGCFLHEVMGKYCCSYILSACLLKRGCTNILKVGSTNINVLSYESKMVKFTFRAFV